jgi:hypothetical protein
MGLHLRAPGEASPLLNQRLAGLVCGMRFSREDELDGPLRVCQQAQQSCGIMQEQVRALVGSKPPGKRSAGADIPSLL